MHISIHALREESDMGNPAASLLYWISIHALREESDGILAIECVGWKVISIHALREESDSLPRSTGHIQPNFNPRSP